MHILVWAFVIIYFAFSTPITYWSVSADIPKIRAEDRAISWWGMGLAIFAVWLVAPILFTAHCISKRN